MDSLPESFFSRWGRLYSGNQSKRISRGEKYDLEAFKFLSEKPTYNQKSPVSSRESKTQFKAQA